MRSDKGLDLGLEALAALQAMEADAGAQAFRDRWTSGRPFANWSSADVWIRSQSPKPADIPQRLLFQFEVPRLPPISGEDHSAPANRRQWMDAWLAANPDASPTVLGHEGPGYEVFDVFAEDGQLTHRQYIEPGSSLEALRAVCRAFELRYGWRPAQGQAFVLLGTVPVLTAIRASIRTNRELGGDIHPAGAFSSEIVLNIRPQATQQAVANAYEAAREETLTGLFSLPTGQRNKPISSPRTRDLAILGGRIVRGDYATWEEARSDYIERCPDEGLTYADDMGRFRRDAKAAFRKITGVQLDWQPVKRKHSNMPVEVVPDEEGIQAAIGLVRTAAGSPCRRGRSNGMSGSSSRDGILKVGPQHYRVFIEVPPKSDGKRRRETRTVRGSLDEAKTVRARLLADKSRGEYVGRSEQRLADYLESWLTWKRSRVSGRTWGRYASLLRSSVIPALGHIRLQDLTPRHLDDFYATCLSTEPGQRKKSKLSPTTVHHRHVALKMALKRAVELGTLVRNPADFTQPPRVDRPEMRVLNEAEVATLLQALEGTPAELVGKLALMTGARLGELLALRWSDLDLVGQVMYVRQTIVENVDGEGARTWYSFKEPKSGKGRTVDLDAGTVARLKAHRAAQSETRLQLGLAWTELDLVITNAVGAPVRPSTASAQFRTVAKSQGFDRLRFHDTRHTHATILLKTGVPPHVVSKRLGHASVAFTLQVYSWVLPGQQREAAEGFAAAVAAK